MSLVKKFLTLDTSIIEIWASIALILLAIYSIIDPLPENMLAFQMTRLWVLEMTTFGIIGIWAVLYKPVTFLRTWTTFIGSLFWFYFSISIVGVHESLTIIVAILMSLSLAIAFLQRSVAWAPNSFKR
jgi:hypothetical protein